VVIAFDFENAVPSFFEHPAGYSNVVGSLAFIASQHPYFNLGLSEILDALRALILENVLHRSDTEERQVLLKSDSFIALYVGIIHISLKLLHRKHQSPHPSSCFFVQALDACLLKMVLIGDFWYDCFICAFDKVDIAAM